MDLRRIVEEVEERRRQDYAMAPPAAARPPAAAGGGVTASILETVRDRMLREDPSADVSSLIDVLEPARATPPPAAPRAKLKAEGTAAAIAREAARAELTARPAPRGAARKGAARDDFLARYLLMSEEFERRYKAKGWTNLVRKRCSSGLRP